MEQLVKNDFNIKSENFSAYKRQKLKESAQILISPIIIGLLSFYLLNNPKIKESKELILASTMIASIIFTIYLLIKTVKLTSAKCPSIILVKNYLIIPFRGIKISIDRIQKIIQVGDEIEVTYKPLKYKHMQLDWSKRTTTFPISILSNPERFLSNEIFKEINSPKEDSHPEVVEGNKNNDSLFFDFLGLIFELLHLTLILIISLWPIWLFIIMLLLIFK